MLIIAVEFNGDGMLQKSGEEMVQPDEQAVPPARNNDQLIFSQPPQRIFNDIFGRHPKAFCDLRSVHFYDVVELRMREPGTERLYSDGGTAVLQLQVKAFGETVDPGFRSTVSSIVQ